MFCHLRSLQLPAAGIVVFTAAGGDAESRRWIAAREAASAAAGPARRHRKNAAPRAGASDRERVYFWATKHTLQGNAWGIICWWRAFWVTCLDVGM